jgi:hypothetical protein
MAGRKILSYDEEIDQYLSGIITNLRGIGIKHPSKADALRFIIKENQEVKLRFVRKPKTKKGILFL